MICRVLADLLVALHLTFVLFVLCGGVLVWRRPRVAWAHVPAVVWGTLLELNGWICPLTPWEQDLRRCAGQAGYVGGFLEHYVLPLLYPARLTPAIQWFLGIGVLTLNLVVYAAMLRRRLVSRSRGA